MKCLACGAELNSGVSVCPICSYHAILSSVNTDEAKKILKEKGKNYRYKKVENADIKIKTYSYKEKNGEIVLDKEEYLPIDGWEKSDINGIHWCTYEFARVERAFDMTVLVKKCDGSEKEHTVQLQCPGTEELWKIAVKLVEGMKVKLLVGNEKKYVESMAIDLI